MSVSKFKKTQRGFGYREFHDANGVDCSIQESSAIQDEALIWFGADDIGLKHFVAGRGWKDVELTDTMQEHYIANTRMHLTQSQVAELIPILQKFVDTGEVQ